MVVCLLCPLVISASPTWWSSRRALACQLKMGPQSTPRVPQSLQSCFFPTFLPRIALQLHPTETTSLFLHSNSGGARCAEFIKPFFSPTRIGSLPRWQLQRRDLFSQVIREQRNPLWLCLFALPPLKSRIKMQTRVSLK